MTGAADAPQPPITNLVFQGGGGKGLAYLGALAACKGRFNNFLNGSMGDIAGVGGASAGAITAFLVACRFPLEAPAGKPSIYSLAHASDFGILLNKIQPGERREISKDGRALPSKSQAAEIALRTTSIGIAWPKQPPKSEISAFVVSVVKDQVASIVQSIAQFFVVGKFQPKTSDNSDDKTLLTLLLKTVLKSSQTVQNTFSCLTSEFGIFSGLELRGVLKNWLNQAGAINLKANSAEDLRNAAKDGSMTFAQFFRMTNVDLRITGTNVTNARPFVFSKRNSPDFPVIEAVGISMSIPVAFKPVFVNDGIKDVPSGYWVDGGVLDNLPLHIFDADSFGGASTPRASTFDKRTLAFRLTPDPTSANVAMPVERTLFEFLYNLGNTLLYPSDSGQVISGEEADNVIDVPCGKLNTLEFSPPITTRADVETHAEKAVKAALDKRDAAMKRKAR